ncbi:hypothetical protein [Nocardia sp. 348MFTsu5.1]|uniref:hypothetical protein n=1 Tax=Nocardia sp. 348MFTsu5.1 TaxID=1172185 RepID=UPI00036C9A60|nr:hypothetical protein [Nocardia sp. 348MFTsu5.1]
MTAASHASIRLGLFTRNAVGTSLAEIRPLSANESLALGLQSHRRALLIGAPIASAKAPI